MKYVQMMLTIAMFMIAACSHLGTSSVDLASLHATEWVLEDLGGRAVEDRVQSTIVFKTKGQLVGWGGCNRYFARFRSEGHSLEIGPIGSTRRICT